MKLRTQGLISGNDEDIVLFQKAVQENAEKLQSEYPRNARPVQNDKILIYNSERVDELLIEDVVKKYGDTKGKVFYNFVQDCSLRADSTR